MLNSSVPTRHQANLTYRLARKKFIDGANEQLESMKELLEGEVPGLVVRRPDAGLCKDLEKSVVIARKR